MINSSITKYKKNAQELVSSSSSVKIELVSSSSSLRKRTATANQFSSVIVNCHKPIHDTIYERLLHLCDNKTELLPGFLPLLPNMPVLLTDNIACELGLSNGIQGIFRELVYDVKEDPVTFNMNNAIFQSDSIYVRKPLYALVEMDSSQVETNLDGLQPKLIPMTLVKKRM